MPIVVARPASFVKGADHIIKISRAAVQAIPMVASDPYFSDISRWKEICFNYKSASQREIEVVKFDANVPEPEGIFSVSVRAINSFILGSIVIHDFDGGSLTLFLEDLPADDTSFQFDIDFPIDTPVTPTLSVNYINTQIQLSWTPVPLEPYYQIWKQTGAGPFIKIQDDYLTNSFTDTDIVADEIYNYYVVLNADEEFYPSNTVQVITASPADVTGFSVDYQTSALFNWSAVAGAGITYRIYKKIVGAAGLGTLAFTGAGLTYTDNSIIRDNDFTYSIVAYNGHYESKIPSIVSIRPATLVINSIAATSATSVNVTWSSAAGEAYSLFYRVVGDPTYTEITNATSPRTVSGLTSAGNYQFYIKATNGPATYITTVFSKTMPYTPTTPVLASTVDDSGVTLSWTNVSPNTTSILVYRKLSTDGTFPSTPTFTVSGAATQYLDSTVSDAKTYNYFVKAEVVDGSLTLTSSNSNTITVAIPGWSLVTATAPFDSMYGTQNLGGRADIMPSTQFTAGSGSKPNAWYYSTDGKNWPFQIDAGNPAAFYISKANGKLFFAGAKNISVGLMYSPDGSSYQPATFTNGTSSTWIGTRSVAYGNGKYVGVGDVESGTGVNRVITSTDSIAWTLTQVNTTMRIAGNPTTNFTYTNFYNVIYFNNMFIATADVGTVADGTGATTRIFTSTDGINWNSTGPQIQLGYSINTIQCINAGIAIVNGVNASGKYVMYRSTDGLNWIELPYADGIGNIHNIQAVNNKFISSVTLANGDLQIYTSPDASTWAVKTLPFATLPTSHQASYSSSSLIFGYINGVYYAVGSQEPVSDGTATAVHFKYE